MTTKTPLGHRAASAVRPAVPAPWSGIQRLRRGDLTGGAVVRRGAHGAPTLLPGDRTRALRRVLTP